MGALAAVLRTLVDVLAASRSLRPSVPSLAAAVIGARGVDTLLVTLSVVSLALVDILACFPVRAQEEPVRAHAEHLVVAVNALVRATSVITQTASTRVTRVVVRTQAGAGEVFTATLIRGHVSLPSLLDSNKF